MRKIIYVTAVALSIGACGPNHNGEKKTSLLSNFLSITDNEDRGVKEALNFYGGECEYSKGVSKSSDEQNGKYFQLELKKSEIIEQQANMSEMPASNIAFRFYKNLKEEKTRYDFIKVILNFSDGTSQSFKYSCSELELVENKIPIANTVVELIKIKKFDSLKNLLIDSTTYDYNKNELIANLSKVEIEFGDITEGFRFLGFHSKQIRKNIRVLHMSGVIVRNKQNTNFSVDVDYTKDNPSLYLIQYKL